MGIRRGTFLIRIVQQLFSCFSNDSLTMPLLGEAVQQKQSSGRANAFATAWKCVHYITNVETNTTQKKKQTWVDGFISVLHFAVFETETSLAAGIQLLRTIPKNPF